MQKGCDVWKQKGYSRNRVALTLCKHKLYMITFYVQSLQMYAKRNCCISSYTWNRRFCRKLNRLSTG